MQGNVQTIRKAAVKPAAGYLLALLLACLVPGRLFLTAFALFLAPFWLLVLAGKCRALPALLCTLATIAAVGVSLFAPFPAAVYLLPVVCAFLFCLKKEVPYPRAALYTGAAYALSIAALYAYWHFTIGADFIARFADRLLELFDKLPERDLNLFLLWRARVLSLPESIAPYIGENPNSFLGFSQPALDEFYNQIRFRLNLILSGLMPSLLTHYSILYALLGTAAGITLGRRHMERCSERAGEPLLPFPTLGMPPFETWTIPKTWTPLMIVLFSGYLIGRIAGGTLATAGTLMFSALTALLKVQGLSLVLYMMKTRGMKGRTSGFILALMVILLEPFLKWIGLIDLTADPRKLRQTKEELP